MTVILSAAKNLRKCSLGILRCAQDDGVLGKNDDTDDMRLAYLTGSGY
jgi:hypothetical protein